MTLILVLSAYTAIIMGILFSKYYPKYQHSFIFNLSFFMSGIVIAIITLFLLTTAIDKYIITHSKIMEKEKEEEIQHRKNIEWHNAKHYAKQVLPEMTEEESVKLLQNAKVFFTEEEVRKITTKALTERKAVYLVKKWKEEKGESK